MIPVTEWVLQQVKNGPVSLDDLAARESDYQRKGIVYALDYLITIRVIVKDGDLYRLPE